MVSVPGVTSRWSRSTTQGTRTGPIRCQAYAHEWNWALPSDVGHNDETRFVLSRVLVNPEPRVLSIYMSQMYVRKSWPVPADRFCSANDRGSYLSFGCFVQGDRLLARDRD